LTPTSQAYNHLHRGIFRADRRRHAPSGLCIRLLSRRLLGRRVTRGPGIDDALGPVPLVEKADDAGHKGMRIATDTSDTQVWTAKNAWEDTDTPAALAAGPTDEARITARPGQLAALLTDVPPAQKVTALLGQIADARAHLLAVPASCAARERREHAFDQLYELAPRLGKTPAQIDAENRQLSDYVFAELSYGQSRTCCWDSTTPAMAEIILARAAEEEFSTCTAPTVFRAHGGGYQIWKDWAAAHGRAEDWLEWSEDEPCARRGARRTSRPTTPRRRSARCLDDWRPPPGGLNLTGCTSSIPTRSSGSSVAPPSSSGASVPRRPRPPPGR